MKIIPIIFACITLTELRAQDRPEMAIHKKDSLQVKNMEDIIIIASRTRESLLQAPASIETAGREFFRNSPSPSFFDALQNLTGVQMITPSMGFRILNTRGFANTTNVRFAQLVDGMDVQSPHIGAPIGNALGPGDLDIEKVEILPGVASALYGMNTINGLADFITRDPFSYTGLSFQQKTAVTHINNRNSGARVFSETSLRWAQRISPKLAYKINGSFTRGHDWIADNPDDLNPKANVSTGLLGDDNPGKDPVNSYGNESANRRTISLQGKSYVVARTGYPEMNLTDYAINNIRLDGGLYYKLNTHSMLSYQFRMAFLDNVYQRANRFMLNNYFLQQQALQLQSASLQVKLYLNSENTGDSYNLRSMGESIDRAFKPDNTWFKDYTSGFNTAMASGSAVADAHRAARSIADAGRYQPGTEIYHETLTRLQQVNNWDSGAALKVKAAFVQGDMQYNLTEKTLASLKKKTGVELIAGFDFRRYSVYPDGNYFINPEPGKTNQDIRYGKTGGFLSLSRSFANEKVKLGAILRADKNDYFPLLFNPRFTLVYTPVRNHYLRFSFQSGYRYPVIFEAYSNVNSGGVKRVGGLPVMSNGIFENAWLQTSISVFQSAVLTDMNRNGLSKNQAIEKNKNLLVKNSYTYIQPEHVNAMEAGYRGLFFHDRIYVDGDFYFSQYRNFIAQANMNVPKTAVADSIPYYLYDNTRQDKYRMWTNSRTNISNYGFNIGVKYRIRENFSAFANTSFAKLSGKTSEDGLEDGFNTPKWMLNAGISHSAIEKNFGAGAGLHWQSSYYWQSFLVNGNVPSYFTLDAHVSYRFAKEKCQVKLGASNLLNRYYYSFLGGPSVGGFYYLTFNYGIF